MEYQSVFKRHELKYILTKEQQKRLVKVMEQYMKLDKYRKTTIRNIYFDTENFRLIRRSLEKPTYKEKLRVRSYSRAGKEDEVFVELKKKYKSVVYKRRTVMPEKEAMDWLCGGDFRPEKTQITDEIDYFKSFYEDLKPRVFLSYDREAYYSLCGDDFRVTFDENILSRAVDLSLDSDIWGDPLLREGTVLMEIKTSAGIPLWMVHFLTEEQIYRTSFSKYGEAYRNMIMGRITGGRIYA